MLIFPFYYRLACLNHLIHFYLLSPNIFLEEIRDGNQESFKRLFHLYHQSLVIYAEGYLFDRALAQDVVQEVFIHLWKNAHTIHIKTSVKGYLYKMVRNKSLNYLKSLKITDSLEMLDHPIAMDFHYSEDMPQEEKIKKFRDVLLFVETMPPRMKAVFHLKYRQQYSHLEISNELDISINTVKTQLRRAKNQLSKHFPYYLFVLGLYLF